MKATFDEIDQFLFDLVRVIPGACSSIESIKYTIARTVAEILWPRKNLASAWTEEDEHTRANLSSLLYNLRVGKKIEMATFEKYYNWLKTIHVKPRKPRKNLALTWEDIHSILMLSYNLDYEQMHEDTTLNEEEHCIEILKRFNEQRKK